jgi:hypothetical protein
MTKTTLDGALMQSIFFHVAGNLGLIVDREIEVEKIKSERSAERKCGGEQIHISFKLGFEVDGVVRHGCILFPLPEASTLAACLMMLPEDETDRARQMSELDEAAKGAMMELGNLVGGAVAEAMRESNLQSVRVVSEGCQGVRPDVPPAIHEPAESEFAIGHAKATITGYPAFSCIAMVPVFW